MSQLHARPAARRAEPVLAIDAVAGDEVVAGGERQQADELGQVELAVAVGQQDPRHPRRLDPRAHGGAVAAVGRVHDDADALVGGRERLGALARGVGGAVVDDDDLHAARAQLGGGERLRDGGADVVLLVEAGQDDGQAGEPQIGRHGRCVGIDDDGHGGHAAPAR